jgi:hypothetical protein
MPLLDHFHAPLCQTHRWPSFHATWAVVLMEALNRILPPQRFLVEVKVSLGTDLEADLAESDQSPQKAQPAWVPPPAAHTAGFVFPDDIEVQVYDLRYASKDLTGALALVSPGNKDQPKARRAFAAKCVAYFQRGVGVLIVDIVTLCPDSLHDAIVGMLGHDEAAMPPGTDVYAVAYRPARRGKANLLDLWHAPLAVGQALPLLPLGLRGAFFVPVDLEATYTEARQRCRL